MAPAAHRQGQLTVAREVDRFDDIGNSEAADDHRWPLVDHPIPDFARVVVIDVGRAERIPVDVGTQFVDERSRTFGRYCHGSPWRPSMYPASARAHHTPSLGKR